MRLEIRRVRVPLSNGPSGPSRAWTADYLRHHLCFALARHGDVAPCVRAELRDDVRAGHHRHRCVLRGATERFGPFRVEGSAPSLHEAIDRALHRFELHLVACGVATRPPALVPAGPQLAA